MSEFITVIICISATAITGIIGYTMWSIFTNEKFLAFLERQRKTNRHTQGAGEIPAPLFAYEQQLDTYAYPKC